jgi:hypothetical protein
MRICRAREASPKYCHRPAKQMIITIATFAHTKPPVQRLSHEHSVFQSFVNRVNLLKLDKLQSVFQAPVEKFDFSRFASSKKVFEERISLN